jgi:hypothetical protein
MRTVLQVLFQKRLLELKFEKSVEGNIWKRSFRGNL